MRRRLANCGLAAATVLTVLVAAPRASRAQDFAQEASIVEGETYNRYKSPQRFAFELTFGPYIPDIDSEFNGARTPYKDYFGSGSNLLTRVEFDVLSCLLEQPGRVYSRVELISRVWGDGFAITDRTIDSHVKALRKKVAEAGAEPGLIETVRGVGYRVTDAPSALREP